MKQHALHDPFNGLTPAQAERLVMLAEDCAGVIHITGKILRHGYDSYHPDRPHVSNRALLGRAVTDLPAVLSLMEGDFGTLPFKDDAEIELLRNKFPAGILFIVSHYLILVLFVFRLSMEGSRASHNCGTPCNRHALRARSDHRSWTRHRTPHDRPCTPQQLHRPEPAIEKRSEQ